MDGREDRAPPRVRRRLILVRTQRAMIPSQQRQTPVSHPVISRTQLRREARAVFPAERLISVPNCTAGPQNWHDSWPIGACGDSAALPVARCPSSCLPAAHASEGDGSSSACPHSATVGRRAAAFKGPPLLTALLVEYLVGRPRCVSSSSSGAQYRPHQSPEVHPSGMDEHS